MADRPPWKFPLCLAACFLFLTSHSTHTQSIIFPQEKSALIHLQSSLSIANADWPTNSDPCTFWNGIRCTNGRVTDINLSGLNRTRQGLQNPNFAADDSLRNLIMLESFNASNFPLGGPIPTWFGQFRYLSSLLLSSCSINGSIPSTIGGLIELQVLDLSNNNLVGAVPSGLFRLPLLDTLDLSRNSLTGPILIDLGSKTSLVDLDMSWNNLSGAIPPSIGSLLHLQILHLNGNALSSSLPIEFNNLFSLYNLDLGCNALSGSLPDNFWSMLAPKSLNLSRNNFTGALPDIDPSNNSEALYLSCDISHNAFYGKITPVIKRFKSAVLSWNYLEGEVPGFAKGNADVHANCLRNTTGQRTLVECKSFYQVRNTTFNEKHRIGLWKKAQTIVASLAIKVLHVGVWDLFKYT